VNGVRKVVGDYATVRLIEYYFCAVIHIVHTSSGASHFYWLCCCIRGRHHHYRPRVSPLPCYFKHEYSPASRNHSSHFEKHKAAFEEGGGRDEAIPDDASNTSADEKPSADDSEKPDV